MGRFKVIGVGVGRFMVKSGYLGLIRVGRKWILGNMKVD